MSFPTPAEARARVQALRPEIERAARDYGVWSWLIAGIIRTESGGDPRQVGYNRSKTTGRITSADYGLMQINSANFVNLGLHEGNWFKVRPNITAGVRLLAPLVRKYGSDLVSIVSVYNCGEDPATGRPRVRPDLPYGVCETPGTIDAKLKSFAYYRSAWAGEYHGPYELGSEGSDRRKVPLLELGSVLFLGYTLYKEFGGPVSRAARAGVSRVKEKVKV